MKWLCNPSVNSAEQPSSIVICFPSTVKLAIAILLQYQRVCTLVADESSLLYKNINMLIQVRFNLMPFVKCDSLQTVNCKTCQVLFIFFENV